MRKGDVVQFNSRHEWCGCFGTIMEVERTSSGVRYTVSVPFPGGESEEIKCMHKEHQLEYIGQAIVTE